MNPLQPKKLRLTKWTATHPVAKDKHFIVVKVIYAEPAPGRGSLSVVEAVDIQAVYSASITRVAWQTLRDSAVWRQGWV